MEGHRQYYHLVAWDELTQRWIGQRAIIEVGTQREQDDDRTVRLGDGRDQQIKEVTPPIFCTFLGEQFLALISQNHPFGPRSLCSLSAQQVQTTPAIHSQRCT